MTDAPKALSDKEMQAIRKQSKEVLLPHMWLRKQWLRRALQNYPLYDPPHKVEERLLSRAQADENFDYFMRVRLQRMADFRAWLRRYFRVTLTPDTRGVKTLSRWGNKYAGLLLQTKPTGGPTDAYFTYQPSWTGANAGCNVVFDMGITLGEFVIANCPKFYWDVDPVSALFPRTARMLKRESGMGFQRPELTGSDNPASHWAALHYVHSFAHHMMWLTTHPSACRHYRRPRPARRRALDELLNNFKSTLSAYPTFGLEKVRQEMSLAEYVNLVDSEAEEEDDHNG
jgi:hypothetical protein